MSAIDGRPTNLSFLAPLNFRFSLKRAPNVNFFVQRVNIPGMSITPTQQPNPFVSIPYSGEHIDFEPLEVTFKVDEDLNNYLEIWNWIRQLGFPSDYSEYNEISHYQKWTDLGITSDMTLLIETSARNPNFEVNFRDAFPVSIGNIEFDLTVDDTEHPQVTALFKYVSYEIVST